MEAPVPIPGAPSPAQPLPHNPEFPPPPPPDPDPLPAGPLPLQDQALLPRSSPTPRQRSRAPAWRHTYISRDTEDPAPEVRAEAATGLGRPWPGNNRGGQLPSVPHGHLKQDRSNSSPYSSNPEGGRKGDRGVNSRDRQKIREW